MAHSAYPDAPGQLTSSRYLDPWVTAHPVETTYQKNSGWQDEKGENRSCRAIGRELGLDEGTLRKRMKKEAGKTA